MSEFTVPSMSDLFYTMTSEALVNEATRFPTFPSGDYILKVSEYSLRPTEEDLVKFKDGEIDTEEATWRLRHRANLTVGVFSKEVKDKRVGGVYQDVSWIERRNEKTGRLDSQSQLYGQLVEALDMADKSVGAVLEAAKKYPLSGYVVELFKMKDGTYKTAKTTEDRAEFTKAGGTPSNKLRSICRIKY